MTYSVRESAEDGFGTAELVDSERDITVTVVPRLGNNTIAFAVNGSNFIFRPQRSLSDLLAARSLFGIPLLAPWANRLSQDEYWVQNRCYRLNRALGNLRFDHHDQAIHGLLLFEPWTVHTLAASVTGAELVSRFDFSCRPSMMAQFPFAHSLEMRHLLRDGRLHVTLRLSSECSEPLPVSVGFHPYYTIPKSHRNEWRLKLAGRAHFALNANQTPTGAVSRVEPIDADVKTLELDDVYSDLIRNGDGEARFSLQSHAGSVQIGFGPQYKVAVVYAPRTGDFVCVEPMATVTNALNLYRNGADIELPMIPPGGVWEEAFWVEPATGGSSDFE